MAIRNLLFNISVLKQWQGPLPTICVGNLSVGGTGKTPHVEYLVRLLSSSINTATLSRGYKRRTKGFILAENSSSSVEIGDEPKQYKTKFPDLTVAVCEDRCKGVEKIMELIPGTGCIILDDAFQHRAIKAGLNILLTDYNKLFIKDHVVPSGTLREFKCGAARADIIIVTKCPPTISDEVRKIIIAKINPNKNQHLFFSLVIYGPLVKLNDPEIEGNLTNYQSALLFSGIANIQPLKEYLLNKKYLLNSLQFSDHHQFSEQDLIKVRESFNNIADRNALIITTEKDAMRIETQKQQEMLKDLPVYYMPIYVEFFPSDKEMFNQIILNYVTNARKNQRNN